MALGKLYAAYKLTVAHSGTAHWQVLCCCHVYQLLLLHACNLSNLSPKVMDRIRFCPLTSPHSISFSWMACGSCAFEHVLGNHKISILHRFPFHHTSISSASDQISRKKHTFYKNNPPPPPHLRMPLLPLAPALHILCLARSLHLELELLHDVSTLSS